MTVQQPINIDVRHASGTVRQYARQGMSRQLMERSE